MRNLIVVLVSLFMLTSCVKEDYDDRYWQQIAIDPEITEFYEWLDITDGLYQFYQIRENGDGFTFTVEGNVVKFTSERQMTEVRLLKSVYHGNRVNLDIESNTVTIEDVDPEWAFRIYFE